MRENKNNMNDAQENGIVLGIVHKETEAIKEPRNNKS